MGRTTVARRFSEHLIDSREERAQEAPKFQGKDLKSSSWEGLRVEWAALKARVNGVVIAGYLVSSELQEGKFRTGSGADIILCTDLEVTTVVVAWVMRGKSHQDLQFLSLDSEYFRK
jgi:hypothetical protein